MFKNTLATQQSVISHGDNDGIHQISAWSRSTLAFFGGRRGFLSQGLDQLSKPNILFGDIKTIMIGMQTLETHGLQWGGIAKSIRWLMAITNY